MKPRKHAFWLLVLGLACVTVSGCAASATARMTATRLRAAVLEDEKVVDDNIATQTKFYKDQTGLINDTRADNITLNVEAFRRSRAAQLATAMSLDPNKEARLSTLMNDLLQTHDQEYQLWQKLYGNDQVKREELKSKIASLERQKSLLTQVEDNLNQLALAPNSKKRAQALLKFSQDAYDAYKKANAGK